MSAAQDPVTFGRTVLVCVLLAAGGAPLAAQQVGPEDAIKKILDEVGNEMQEIDRLLLQSAHKPAAEGMQQNADKLRELMNQTQDSQGRVVRGLDRLIDELQKMQQSGGGGSPQDSDDQPQDGQPKDGQQPGQQPQGERQQTETPDLVKQGQQQDGQQQGQPKPGEGQQPKPGPDPLSMGQNKPSGPPKQDGEEKVDRPADAERWGDLPKVHPVPAHAWWRAGGSGEIPARLRGLPEAREPGDQRQDQAALIDRRRFRARARGPSARQPRATAPHRRRSPRR